MNKYLESTANKGDPPLRQAVGEIIHRISSTLPDLKEPVKMYLAGGMAVNFYTGYRPTVDIDASFSHRLLLPKAENLVVSYEGADGKPKMVYFDMNYNTSFALMHPDFEKDAYRVEGDEFKDSKIELHIITPVDLALSKIARLEENDKEDIAALARHNLIDPTLLEDRAAIAMDYYIGDQSMLRLNLEDAVDIARTAKMKSEESVKAIKYES
jgi:hypothetical protein